MKRKICFITGSRAEYGLLHRLIQMVHDDDDCILQIVATNMHLSDEYGVTYKEIEEDGFHIDKKVYMLLSSDSDNAIVKSMGLGLIGLADAIEDLRPDLMVVLGDRYEMLMATSAALIYKIPIAHLYGGDITEGAYDDSIRHALTKMSCLHFTATESARKRVIQMGETSGNVFNVGSLGIDNIRHMHLMSKEETEKSLEGFTLDEKTILITFHPVTLEQKTAKKQMSELLTALDQLDCMKIIFTMPNSDTDGKVIIQMIKNWCSKNANRSKWFVSLGTLRYLSTLQYIKAVVGNSSSGIVEAPSFGIVSVNIGDRQKGRIQAKSIINCTPLSSEIRNAIEYALLKEKQSYINPYEKKDTAKKIFNMIKNVEIHHIFPKKFQDIE